MLPSAPAASDDLDRKLLTCNLGLGDVHVGVSHIRFGVTLAVSLVVNGVVWAGILVASGDLLRNGTQVTDTSGTHAPYTELSGCDQKKAQFTGAATAVNNIIFQ